MTTYLTLDDLLILIEDLGVGPMRDGGLLDSAAHRPASNYWGREVYVGLDEKAAALMQSIVGNHPLVDGNKRLGWLAVVVFYAVNGVELEVPDGEAYDFVIEMAEGGLTVPSAAEQLAGWR